MGLLQQSASNDRAAVINTVLSFIIIGIIITVTHAKHVCVVGLKDRLLADCQ